MAERTGLEPACDFHRDGLASRFLTNSEHLSKNKMEEGIRFGRMRGSSPLPIFKIGAIDQLCQPSKKSKKNGPC